MRMKNKLTLIITAMIMAAVGGQAQVTVATFANLGDPIQASSNGVDFVLSQLNTTPIMTVPTYGGTAAVVSGSLAGVGNFGPADTVTLNFKGVWGYSRVAMQDAIANSQVLAELDSYLPAALGDSSGGYGVTSSGVITNIDAGVTNFVTDPKSTGITGAEAIVIEVDLSNVATNELTLEQLSIRVTGGDLDIYIVAPDGTVQVVIERDFPGSNSNPLNLAVNQTVVDGAKIVIGNTDAPPSNQRWLRFMGLSFDVDAEPSTTVEAPSLVLVPTNQAVQVSWSDQTHPAYAGVALESSTDGTNFNLLATVTTGNEYVHSGLLNDATYYYRGRSLSNASYTVYSPIISADTFFTIPHQVEEGSTTGDQRAVVRWEDSEQANWSSFRLYRSLTPSITVPDDLISSGMTNNVYVDNAVYNNVNYYYALSQVDTDGVESGISKIILVEPTSDDVIVYETDNRGKSYYIPDDQLDGVYNSTPPGTAISTVIRTGTRVSFGGNPDRLYRWIQKFRFNTTTTNSTIGTKTADDIEQAVLRIYLDDVRLLAGDAYTDFEVYVSTATEIGTGVDDADFFDNANFSITAADNSGVITTNTGVGWVEFDVTAETKTAFASEGSSTGLTFRVQLANDHAIPTNVLSSLGGVDNSGSGQYTDVDVPLDFGMDKIPQLRIRYEIPGPFDDWVMLYGLPANSEEEDDDDDGVVNLAEYALNGNPTNGVDDTEVMLVTDGGLSLVHAQVSDDDSLVYMLETRDNLVSGVWSNMGYTAVSGTDVTGGMYNYVSNSVPTTDGQKFIRVKVIKSQD